MRERGGPNADTTLGALTPEGIEYTLHPAGPAARAIAFAADTVIQWIIILAAIIISQSMRNALGVWFILLLMFAVDWFYHVAAELLLGQSPGKRLTGIRVIQRDGSPVRFPASMLRNLMRFADTFLGLFQMALFTMCFSRGFRRLGDLAADTLVVYTAASRFIRPHLASSLTDDLETGAALVLPPVQLSVEEKQTLIAFARRYTILGPSRADEIVKPWTDTLGFQPGHRATDTPARFALNIAKNWTGAP